MDNKVILKPSVLEDVFQLETSLRTEDIRELVAIGSNPSKALLKGFIYSNDCVSVWAKNKVIGMFGVSSWGLPKGFATIWFLGSDDLFNYPVTFVKEGIKYVNKNLQKYDILFNAVDARNTHCIKWLKKIGMNISNSMFINGYEFIQFFKVRS